MSNASAGRPQEPLSEDPRGMGPLTTAAHRGAARTIVFGIVLALLLSGCEGVAVSTPTPVTITIGGATAMKRVLRDLTTEFGRQHPNVLFVLRGGGSTLGEEDVTRGELDLAASTLYPTVPEGEGSPTPDALVRIPIGVDALAIVLHPTNNVSQLSLVQLRDIYAGRVIDWQALGSRNGEILLVSREDGSGARVLFEDRVMGDERVSLTAVVMPTSQDVVEFVGKNPQAIGYVTQSEVRPRERDSESTSEAAPVLPVKVVSVEGKMPEAETVVSQQYPLTEPLYLISNGQPTGVIRQFIDFALSPAGQAIVNRHHVSWADLQQGAQPASTQN